MNLLLILIGKTITAISRLLNIGNGSTWPGHIALLINKNFSKQLILKSKIKTVFIAGTNGKTTTAKLIKNILNSNNKKAFLNRSGANLLNGIASTLIENSNLSGQLNFDYGIFEIDENTLPIASEVTTPDYLILLNLYRDQLDRYGEIDTIATKWKKAIQKIPEKTTLILNADDPLIASLGEGINCNKLYFGLNDKFLIQKKNEHASDSIYCPKCNTKLNYSAIYFSHLGIWDCPKCGFKRPKLNIDKTDFFPLSGTYNKYNTLAACLFSDTSDLNPKLTSDSLKNFIPAFGRQEKIEIKGRFAQIFLSKNPISFNESLRTIKEQKAKNILFVLNDRIPDGRDVSWIWDTDIEDYLDNFKNILVSGDRAYDMALRIKYSKNVEFLTFENLKDAIKKGLEQINTGEILFILPTYSAMLEVRKILTGKKIL